ncbi:glutaminase GtaA [Mytilinidion resinicola]|uniref:Glutaminase GtaA n=1 Tax=Mytilinidion resinicola TaxID=574789 RepID=A0A6A6YCX6_9PEZI|nr:glutaminase GtaA [Mytilinidion resinicola]KAF2806560.1 glutaminase GtaA [Mytilinidion resinicola]
MIPTVGLILSLLLAFVTAQSVFTPARPPSIPLAVKSPYLSTWLPAGASGTDGGYLPGHWPTFWAGQVLGWAGIVRVDNTSYVWMGNPLGFNNLTNQTSAEYTSTSSTFTMDVAGKVFLTVKFLSPVYPNDLKRQSLIFSYMDVEVVSADGNDHDIQLYTDISAEFVSGDRGDVAEWDSGNADDVVFHKIWKQTPLLFSEKNDQSEWGNWYYATDGVDGLSWATGADTDVRGSFSQDGRLSDTKDTNWRAIDDHWPVFAFSVDLGSVGTDSANALFTIGLCQDDAIQFLGKSGVVSLPSLWSDFFDEDEDALTFFHHDYDNAVSKSSKLDGKIAEDSVAAAGADYLTITSLTVRQAFGGLELVGTEKKPYLFLKEISSDGNAQTVDVMFPAHPILLYTNPQLLKLLLDPLFENQESGHYPNKWSIHDLGRSFPNATGHPEGDDEAMPLEECGNMLIMTLAYWQQSGDSQYLREHYKILDQWTQYLIDEALIPKEQLSTDDFAGALVNQTDLALKGMIGIQAMANIADITSYYADARNYTAIAASYIKEWQTLGINHIATPPHTTLNYGNNASWGLLYNLYADALLNTSLVPASVYAQQSAFYPTVAGTYGVPLDTRHAYTKTDWQLWAAAVASEDTRDLFIGCIAKWIQETPLSVPFTDIYETGDGGFGDAPHFMARPVMGGAFALLALPKEGAHAW